MCDVSTQNLCYGTDLEDGNLGIKLMVFQAAGEVLEQKNSCQFYRLLDCAIS